MAQVAHDEMREEEAVDRIFDVYAGIDHLPPNFAYTDRAVHFGQTGADSPARDRSLADRAAARGLTPAAYEGEIPSRPARRGRRRPHPHRRQHGGGGRRHGLGHGGDQHRHRLSEADLGAAHLARRLRLQLRRFPDEQELCADHDLACGRGAARPHAHPLRRKDPTGPPRRLRNTERQPGWCCRATRRPFPKRARSSCMGRRRRSC